MKTRVLTYPELEKIEVPEALYRLEIPTTDKIIQPVTDFAKAQGDEDPAHIETLAQQALNMYVQQQLQSRYFGEILPWIRQTIYKESELQKDSEEEAAYIKQYFHNLEQLAAERELSLEAYGTDVMKLEAPIKEAFTQQAKEDFAFKALAHHLYDETPDSLTYDAFIQQQVLQTGADEIEVRASFSYEDFCQSFPEMLLLDQIGHIYQPRIEIVQHPDVEFNF